MRGVGDRVNDVFRSELQCPGPGFFVACAGALEDPAGATEEAIESLTPGVDWAAYQPHLPHGLLGLAAVWKLRPLLAPGSFLRLLATQIHALAHEVRSLPGKGLAAVSRGSGSWSNLRMALDKARPSIAWGEALGVETPSLADFLALEAAVEPDMANVGHKAVLARELGDLFQILGEPVQTGRVLLALTAWACASEPRDRFWNQRATKRLPDSVAVPHRATSTPDADLQAALREICDSGLVDLLDSFSARVRGGAGSGDLLAALVLAAAEKQLDARRDLEGKTAWNFVVLSRLARRAPGPQPPSPQAWVQAAALVNLFPTDEPGDRPCPKPPRCPVADPAVALLDAILDAEPLQALFHAQALLDAGRDGDVLTLLAEAASRNDPAFNQSHQVLAVAAGAELAPQVPGTARHALLLALAKSLANSQGSSDLGRQADQALGDHQAGFC